MSSDNNGGPAFPGGLEGKVELAGGRYDGAHVPAYRAKHEGMSLRDYFAAKALQGLLARGIHYQTEARRSTFQGLEEVDIAGHAYAMADAMLKARESNNA